MKETIDIASKETWERAKEIYLSTLKSIEEKGQVDRYLSMIVSVTREGDNFVVLTSNAYAAEFLKKNYSERLHKCLELVSDGEKVGLDFRFDETAQTPYYTYTDEVGQAHEVWFEDARSVLAKLDLWERYALRGISVWNLMRPFAAAKTVLNARFAIEERTTAQNDL